MPYNPSLHTVTNKSLGIAQANPTDARSYFYDEANFVYRPYESTAEVLSYLNTPEFRTGQFSIIVSDGVLIHEYWFKDGVADSDLVEKITDGAGNVYTADNGLQPFPTANNFQLGGPLINDTFIDTGAKHLVMTGISADYEFKVSNTGNGNAAYFVGNTNPGATVENASDTRETLYILKSNITPSVNTVSPMIRIDRMTAGTAANGMGASIDIRLEDAAGVLQSATKLISFWKDATLRTSQLILTGIDAGTIKQLITADGNFIQLNQYGSGLRTGIPAYALQVDAEGNIIEGATLSGGPPTLAATQIGFGSAGNLLTGSADLTWDNTGKILKIGFDPSNYTTLFTSAAGILNIVPSGVQGLIPSLSITATTSLFKLLVGGDFINSGTATISLVSLTGLMKPTGATVTLLNEINATATADASSSAITTVACYNGRVLVNAAFTGTITNAVVFRADQGATPAGIVTNLYYFMVTAPPGSVNATNFYAFHSAMNAATGRWNLYMTGTAANRLNGNTGIGIDPTAKLHIAAGAAGVGTAPIKLTSGTNNTTPETGAIEYNGTNLFFTRTGTTRENIICAATVNTVSPTAPNRTVTVNINGTTYYLAAKTTND